jgi:transketolase
MTTMRDRFTAVAGALLDENPDIVLVLADIGVSQFAALGVTAKHPDQIINVGIREQLMAGFAAGLAKEGLRPIIHSYTPFLVERPYEQLKLDFGHQGVGAIAVSTGASYDGAPAGRTHQSPADIGLLATLPGWNIHVPGHPDEVERLLREASVARDSHYIRLAEDMNASAVSTSAEMVVVRRGSKDCPVVIAAGPTLDDTVRATSGIDLTVLYASTVRPFDGDTLRSVAGGTDVILVEPYLVGTSSAEVGAALVDVPHRLLALGVPLTEHRHYGTGAQHKAAHGLNVEGLERNIREFLKAPVTV